MNKKNYLYFIKRLNIKSWIKYWLLSVDFVKYILSEIYSGIFITINNTINKPIEIISILGNSLQDGEPTTENPVDIESVGDDGQVNIKIINKNWIDEKDFIQKIKESGLTVTEETYNDTPCYKIGRVNTWQYSYDLEIDTTKQYAITITGVISGNGLFQARNINDQGVGGNLLTTTWGTNTKTPTGAAKIYIAIYNISSYIYIAKDSLQIELGATKTDIEYHQEKIYTIPIQYPLRKIKDVQDELDISNKKEIHRIGYIESYTDEEITTDYISTTGELSEGASVIYVLDEPIELDMTDEQLSIISNMPRAYDNQTNIYSLDIPSPYVECQAYVKKEV